jgi:hypothetical protein
MSWPAKGASCDPSASVGERPCPKRVQWLLDRPAFAGDDTLNGWTCCCACANFSYNITKAVGLESNEYLLDAATYAYLLGNYHYTDDMRRMTRSAGASSQKQPIAGDVP